MSIEPVTEELEVIFRRKTQKCEILLSSFYMQHKLIKDLLSFLIMVAIDETENTASLRWNLIMCESDCEPRGAEFQVLEF